MLINPRGFIPEALVGYVQCTGGHPLKALYVLYRPKAATDMPAEFVEEILTSFTLAWSGPYGDLHLVDPEQDGRIHLGFRDPAALSPHAIKLMNERAYDCYFIRHPDIEVARQAQAELNGMRPLSLTKEWKPVEVTARMTGVYAPALMSALALSVDEAPGMYYPPGPAQYGGWTLYKDMPNEECAGVKKAVQKLQEELGALRYMVGAEHPYMPEQLANNKSNLETANEGYFDGRTINSVYLFQTHVKNGEGWKVDPAKTIATAGRNETEESSLQYLVGTPYTGGGRDVTADGVVEQKTAAAIADRLKEGVCLPKQMKIMVCTRAREKARLNWNVWMREEAAAALYCWRELTRALGFPETIAANHTFRSAAVNVGSAGFGRSWKSIHKVGLAIDVGLDKSYFNAAEDWPVFYQRDVVVNKNSKKGELESFRIYWRVFAVSNLLIPEEAAIAACREALTKLMENTHPLGALAKTVAAKLITEIDGKTFVAKYFREKIKQWDYDPWDGDGGKEGPEMTAKQARARQLSEAEKIFAGNEARRKEVQKEIEDLDAIPKANRTKDWKGARKNRAGELAGIDRSEEKRKGLYGNWTKSASRFLDLTALANESGLGRIGSFSNNVDPKNASEWGLGVVTYTTAKFKALAKAVQDARNGQPHLMIEIAGAEVQLARVDAQFLVDLGAGQIECAVSKDKAGEKRVAKFCETLRQFGTRRFLRLPEAVAQTGEEWAAAVEAKLEELKTAAPVDKKDSSKASTKKKDMSAWTFRLQPDFALTGEPVYFPPKTAVQLPSPGAPIGLEWWHFQVDRVIDRQSFGPLICDLGWTKETLLDDPSPFLHYRFGMGYPQNAWTVPAG